MNAFLRAGKVILALFAAWLLFNLLLNLMRFTHLDFTPMSSESKEQSKAYGYYLRSFSLENDSMLLANGEVFTVKESLVEKAWGYRGHWGYYKGEPRVKRNQLVVNFSIKNEYELADKENTSSYYIVAFLSSENDWRIGVEITNQDNSFSLNIPEEYYGADMDKTLPDTLKLGIRRYLFKGESNKWVELVFRKEKQ